MSPGPGQLVQLLVIVSLINKREFSIIDHSVQSLKYNALQWSLESVGGCSVLTVKALLSRCFLCDCENIAD